MQKSWKTTEFFEINLVPPDSLDLYERREKEIENCILEDSTYAEFKIYNTLDFVLKKLNKVFDEHNKKFSILNKKIYLIELISKLLVFI